MYREDWLMIRFYVSEVEDVDTDLLESLWGDVEDPDDRSPMETQDDDGILFAHVMRVYKRTREELRAEIAALYTGSKILQDAYILMKRESPHGHRRLGVEGERFPTEAEAIEAMNRSDAGGVAYSYLEFPELDWIDDFLEKLDL